jgi:hypothetical protein
MNTPQLLVVIVGGDSHIRGSRFLDSAETGRRTMLGLHRRVCVGLAAGAR